MSHELRELDEIGIGLFLAEPVAAGHPIVVFGGEPTPGPHFRLLTEERQRHALQVDDDVFLVGQVGDIDERVNHSCDPTGVLVDAVTLVAARDLASGAQITYDYATTDSVPYDEFECECGSARCRGKVTAEDWMDPVVRSHYDGHFSPYLQAKIDRADVSTPA
ncbi:MAG: SET domain-containing protein-lysine N-methyltransferase [Ilumatobacter sp.]|uniref:SET domain-containing protein-lysine N-methyltransferase n=1 Tax=Ilumatobacter sp. TaxID=1967498 RepID=UPI00391A7931